MCLHRGYYGLPDCVAWDGTGATSQKAKAMPMGAWLGGDSLTDRLEGGRLSVPLKYEARRLEHQCCDESLERGFLP